MKDTSDFTDVLKTLRAAILLTFPSFISVRSKDSVRIYSFPASARKLNANIENNAVVVTLTKEYITHVSGTLGLTQVLEQLKKKFPRFSVTSRENNKNLVLFFKVA